VTSTAASKRYGEQGGRWAPTRKGDGLCHTCRNHDARFQATHRTTGDTWPVCGQCRDQGQRLDAPINYRPLGADR
jgi:hypothetical protein